MPGLLRRAQQLFCCPVQMRGVKLNRLLSTEAFAHLSFAHLRKGGTLLSS